MYTVAEKKTRDKYKFAKDIEMRDHIEEKKKELKKTSLEQEIEEGAKRVDEEMEDVSEH